MSYRLPFSIGSGFNYSLNNKRKQEDEDEYEAHSPSKQSANALYGLSKSTDEKMDITDDDKDPLQSNPQRENPEANVETNIKLQFTKELEEDSPKAEESEQKEDDNNDDDIKPQKLTTYSLDNVKYVENELTIVVSCMICYEIMKDPTLMTCGHSVCSNCFKKINDTCPQCRTTISKVNQKNFLIKDILDQLEVKCLSPECDWKGTKSKLITHIGHECKYIFVCKCGLMLNANQKDKHEKECPLTDIECGWCKTLVIRSYLTKHKTICNSREVICDPYVIVHNETRMQHLNLTVRKSETIYLVCGWSGTREEFIKKHECPMLRVAIEFKILSNAYSALKLRVPTSNRTSSRTSNITSNRTSDRTTFDLEVNAKPKKTHSGLTKADIKSEMIEFALSKLHFKSIAYTTNVRLFDVCAFFHGQNLGPPQNYTLSIFNGHNGSQSSFATIENDNERVCFDVSHTTSIVERGSYLITEKFRGAFLLVNKRMINQQDYFIDEKSEITAVRLTSQISGFTANISDVFYAARLAYEDGY